MTMSLTELDDDTIRSMAIGAVFSDFVSSSTCKFFSCDRFLILFSNQDAVVCELQTSFLPLKLVSGRENKFSRFSSHRRSLGHSQRRWLGPIVWYCECQVSPHYFFFPLFSFLLNKEFEPSNSTMKDASGTSRFRLTSPILYPKCSSAVILLYAVANLELSLVMINFSMLEFGRNLSIVEKISAKSWFYAARWSSSF